MDSIETNGCIKKVHNLVETNINKIPNLDIKNTLIEYYNLIPTNSVQCQDLLKDTNNLIKSYYIKETEQFVENIFPYIFLLFVVSALLMYSIQRSNSLHSMAIFVFYVSFISMITMLFLYFHMGF